ncbi:MAG: flagellar basal body P-ring protein FlgI [Planctomycetaceae bacterium]
MSKQPRFIACLMLLLVLCSRPALADLRIGDICRIKGQEENTLHGMGLVVGLKGTGDSDSKATQRALAQYMNQMGHRIGTDAKGQLMLDELKSVKNVAMVFVEATVPAGGAQQGDIIDCKVSALSAKSLDGGTLMLTHLFGPLPGDKTVYALANGPISIDDVARPQVGRISLGAQIETRFKNDFVKDGKVILVVNKDHASFQTTADLERTINLVPDFGSPGDSSRQAAKAIDQTKVEITIPHTYATNPTQFVAVLLDTRIYRPQTDTKVIINERKKAIVVGADVEVGAVAVMHKNRVIQVGADPVGQFVEVDPSASTGKTRLSALVDALNNLKVPAEDVIDIVKMLKHKNALFGELIFE